MGAYYHTIYYQALHRVKGAFDGDEAEGLEQSLFLDGIFDEGEHRLLEVLLPALPGDSEAAQRLAWLAGDTDASSIYTFKDYQDALNRQGFNPPRLAVSGDVFSEKPPLRFDPHQSRFIVTDARGTDFALPLAGLSEPFKSGLAGLYLHFNGQECRALIDALTALDRAALSATERPHAPMPDAESRSLKFRQDYEALSGKEKRFDQAFLEDKGDPAVYLATHQAGLTYRLYDLLYRRTCVESLKEGQAPSVRSALEIIESFEVQDHLLDRVEEVEAAIGRTDLKDPMIRLELTEARYRLWLRWVKGQVKPLQNGWLKGLSCWMVSLLNETDDTAFARVMGNIEIRFTLKTLYEDLRVLANFPSMAVKAQVDEYCAKMAQLYYLYKLIYGHAIARADLFPPWYRESDGRYGEALARRLAPFEAPQMNASYGRPPVID